MSAATLSLPPGVQLETGPGGLPQLLVHNPLARARIALHGAQLLSFQPHGQPDWLFLSPRARFQPGQPVRGGVPVCWPWFGPDPDGLGRPAHGFARQSMWALREAAHEADGATRLCLALGDDDATRALYPHRFELLLQLRLGQDLQLRLSTHNRGDVPLRFTEALHSYFAVEHIQRVQVLGLQHSPYIDQVPGAAPTGAASGEPLRFEGRLDRIYLQPAETIRLLGAPGGRGLSLRSGHSRHAVVWNPGAALAAEMADLGAGAHQGFACVETANTGEAAITLAPGEQHTLALNISADAAAD